jgi:predicted short-subunit dehydrogenase-like oxidoreductase (DUF2520 family)
MKLVLIGAGNVATYLGKAFKKAGHDVLQIYSRSESSTKGLAKKLSCPFTTDIKKINPKAEFYIIAVSDNSIPDVVRSFNLPLNINPIVLHTSGSVSIKVFGKKFKHCGVLYPLYPFTKAKSVSFKKVPLIIESSDEVTKRKLRQVCSTLSKNVIEMSSTQRKSIQLAAVFANNFTNHLLVLAEKYLAEKKISFDILRPLILESAKRIQHNSPSLMQTGPAKRGDTEILDEHIQLLKDNPKLQQIYKLLSESIEKESGIIM